MAKTSSQRLYDALQAIASIQRLTAFASRHDFLSNEMFGELRIPDAERMLAEAGI
jgi:uncharacterized protein with HEPN domain